MDSPLSLELGEGSEKWGRTCSCPTKALGEGRTKVQSRKALNEQNAEKDRCSLTLVLS